MKHELWVQIRLTWVSGDQKPQQVQYGDGKKQTSQVTTFSQDDMQSQFLNILYPYMHFSLHVSYLITVLIDHISYISRPL